MRIRKEKVEQKKKAIWLCQPIQASFGSSSIGEK